MELKLIIIIELRVSMETHPTQTRTRKKIDKCDPTMQKAVGMVVLFIHKADVA
jgi:hypothetical protein